MFVFYPSIPHYHDNIVNSIMGLHINPWAAEPQKPCHKVAYKIPGPKYGLTLYPEKVASLTAVPVGTDKAAKGGMGLPLIGQSPPFNFAAA